MTKKQLREAIVSWTDRCECGWEPGFDEWTASPCDGCAGLRAILESPDEPPDKLWVCANSHMHDSDPTCKCCYPEKSPE